MAAAMSDAPVSREYRTGSDPRTLRDALGCFATGVTVVTCLDGEERPVGLTANSFTALSLDPPLLLVCVAKAAASALPLAEARHFAVNVLQTGQQPASIRFSTRDEFATQNVDLFGTRRWHLDVLALVREDEPIDDAPRRIKLIVEPP